MELKVGMYVRFNYHRVTIPIQISKIKEKYYDEMEKYYYYLTDNGLIISEENIIKSNENIIDLIEIGDYVNGHKVIEIIKDFKVIVDKSELNTSDGNYYLKTFTNNQIKDIVTKEQFETMKYIIEK